MNFLEFINKCLLELNYRQVNTFSELIKNDHKKIINIINIVNKEICNVERWNFLLRKTTLTLPANTTEIANTIPGRIWYLIIDGQKYKYSDDIEPFLTENANSNTFSIIDDKLLFPNFNEEKTINIVYYSKKGVLNSQNEEKEDLEYEDDKTIIPMPFAEQLLVYGTCLRLKANPQYIRFPYWMGMYKEALTNLKSKNSVYSLNSPIVKLFRN